MPALVSEMEKHGMKDTVVVCGGVIPEQDYQFLYDAGVSAVFGPGTVISRAAIEMIDILKSRGVSS